VITTSQPSAEGDAGGGTEVAIARSDVVKITA